jgi:hypothetical protein
MGAARQEPVENPSRDPIHEAYDRASAAVCFIAGAMRKDQIVFRIVD